MHNFAIVQQSKSSAASGWTEATQASTQAVRRQSAKERRLKI